MENPDSSKTTKRSLLDKAADQLEIIREQTGINPKIFIIVLLVSIAFTIIGYFENYITNVTGMVFPAYWSIKAIESYQTDDDKQWLTYWVVYATFSIIDLFSSFVLKFIPFYFFIKNIFLIWCFMPNTRGATYIYDLLIKKIFKQYEKDIDSAAEKILKVSEQTISEAKEIVRDNQGKIIQAGMTATTKVCEAVNDKKTD